MTKRHSYNVSVVWTGNTGVGTAAPASYERSHVVAAEGKTDIPASSDPAFRRDPTRWNPEELLVASLSQCRMLWYLELCAKDGILVAGYEDSATVSMIEDADGSGRFTEVVLRPRITLGTLDDQRAAEALHHTVHRLCFIANSVNFPVTVEAPHEVRQA